MNNIHPAVLDALREEYPPGCAVELVEMNDPYVNMPPGLHGKVIFVDDIGTIHVAWENGSSLGVVFQCDRLKRI